MENLKSIFIILLFSFFNTVLNAQCADIYFYRFNGLQSDTPVHLFQNGERLATVRIGDRYKASVCTAGNYEFVVKTKEDNMSLIKKNVNVEMGESYYLKITCMIGTDVAGISNKGASKGRKDFNKGSKFKGAVKNININNAAPTNSTISTAPARVPSRINNAGFQRSQIVGDFQFDIIEVVKAGDAVSFAMKVTNLSNQDLNLFTSYYNIYFYDDMGNLLSANDLCLINTCDNGNSTITRTYKQASSRTKALIPYGIPVNMSITVRNVRNGSKKFTRGTLQFGSFSPATPSAKNYFEMVLNDVVFPEAVDVNNPNKRNFGPQSMELIGAKRSGKDVVVHYNFINNSSSSSAVRIESATAYDNLGNAHQLDNVAFVDQNQKMGRRGQYSVNNNSQLGVFIFLKDVPANANEIKRLKLQLNGFTLDWENIRISGIAPSVSPSGNTSSPRINQARSAYINYSDFEVKVRNNENVVGKKIILERIYFESGSDELQTNSHAQLNQLASLMQSNSQLKVVVSGHTDNVGEDMSNMILSQKRADAIKYYLMGQSITPERISSVGQGKGQPISDNASAEGRKENRRVEILIVE